MRLPAGRSQSFFPLPNPTDHWSLLIGSQVGQRNLHAVANPPRDCGTKESKRLAVQMAGKLFPFVHHFGYKLNGAIFSVRVLRPIDKAVFQRTSALSTTSLAPNSHSTRLASQQIRSRGRRRLRSEICVTSLCCKSMLGAMGLLKVTELGGVSKKAESSVEAFQGGRRIMASLLLPWLSLISPALVEYPTRVTRRISH